MVFRVFKFPDLERFEYSLTDMRKGDRSSYLFLFGKKKYAKLYSSIWSGKLKRLWLYNCLEYLFNITRPQTSKNNKCYKILYQEIAPMGYKSRYVLTFRSNSLVVV